MKLCFKKIGTSALMMAALTAAHPAQAEMKFSEIGDMVSVSGQVRVRPEFRHNLTQAVPSTPGAREEDFSTLLRTRLGLSFDATEHVRFFLQVQDSRDFGEEAAGLTGIVADDEGVDLHQGYIDYTNIAGSNFNLRVGRQEIALGAQRLVGVVDWSNTGRALDGGVLSYADDNWWVGLVAVQANKTAAGDQTLFGGLYATWKQFPKGALDVYYLALHDSDGAAGAAAGTGNIQSVHTGGVRLKSDPGRWDLEAEGAVQLGKFGSNSIFAYAAYAGVGFTFEDTYKTKLKGSYSYGTGDDGGNNKYTKFNNLFPTNHNKYGYMDLGSWSNLHDGRVEFSIKPAEKWKIALDYHLFMVDKATSAGDTFAGLAGAAGLGKLAGHEGDLTIWWELNANASFMAGYSHLIPGAFLKDQGITQHADFGYIQMLAQF